MSRSSSSQWFSTSRMSEAEPQSGLMQRHMPSYMGRYKQLNVIPASAILAPRAERWTYTHTHTDVFRFSALFPKKPCTGIQPGSESAAAGGFLSILQLCNTYKSDTGHKPRGVSPELQRSDLYTLANSIGLQHSTIKWSNKSCNFFEKSNTHLKTRYWH